ncbi:MAG: efflux RND transporter periplasmic adaptor subunit, partial [Cytophagales bacterium]
WSENVGTKVEFESRELAYQNAKAALYSAKVKYNDLRRQLNFTASQSKKNLLISSKLESDYTLRSKIDGIVYSLNKEEGEIVSPQTPLAVIGDADNFILEMQVDEYDILKVSKGLLVLVTMDSYKNKVFEAKITKIFPLMNERSKTFLVESSFINRPKILYPNISFEANIVLQTKQKALLIPRNYLINDSTVMKSNGDRAVIKTGLKDYQMVEIVSGLGADDELKKEVK